MNTTSDPLLDIQSKVLSATFSHNMAVLKTEMPDIYNFYKNYIPKNTLLIFDANNHVNLMANGELVYKGNPLLESNKQVEKFIEDPNHIRYQIDLDGASYFEHEKVLHKIINKRESRPGKMPQYTLSENEQIDFIAFMGAGLGYHLESLFAKIPIRSALIYEPDPDCFYATLHNIDIAKLLGDCQKNGGNLTLKIGGGSAGFVNEISSIFSEHGYFNIAHMYLYRHYLSERTTDAFNMVRELAYRYVSSWGFFEDETISLTHTLSNISTYKYPAILTTAKENNRQQPVFIIGNGPSLDASYEYLKENRKNALFISCGTALKPLLDNDIVPDIHVEVERTTALFEWVDKVGHKDKLKEMYLICLNTVYPKILKLFKEAFIILKPRDAGTAFIQEFISDKYAEINNCNPTVSNAASASVVAMGFKNLYLFGVDYGFKSEEHHHSKDSVYFTNRDELNITELEGAMKVKGNFGGDVYTTHHYDRSRLALEMLLEENPDVKCVNTSDGAKVQLTTPSKLADLPIFNKLQKKSDDIASILNESFDNKDYENTDLNHEFKILLPKFELLMKQLLEFNLNVKTRLDLVNSFSLQYNFVADINNNQVKKLFHRFIHGSLNYFQSNIMSNTYFYTDKKQQEDYIQFCLKIMNEHFWWLLDELKNNYNKPSKI